MTPRPNRRRRLTTAALGTLFLSNLVSSVVGNTWIPLGGSSPSAFDNIPDKQDRLESFASTYSCAAEGRGTCATDNDCKDAAGATGADSQCGFAWCHVSTGTCVYDQWDSKCASYIGCKDWSSGVIDHSKCAAGGPSAVGAKAGLCIGHDQSECVHAWCPPSGGVSAAGVPESTQAKVRVYDCTVDMLGCARPMLGEQEMLHFGEAAEVCIKKAYPLASIKEVEVLGQEWDTMDTRRELQTVADDGRDGASENSASSDLNKRRLDGFRNKTKMRKTCSLCTGSSLGYDRRRALNADDVFDRCMIDALVQGVGMNDEKLGAFRGCYEASSICVEDKTTEALLVTFMNPRSATSSMKAGTSSMLPDTSSMTAAVPLGDHTIAHTHIGSSPTTGTDDTPETPGGLPDTEDEVVGCQTTLHDSVVPMLSAREVLHLDQCFISSYNQLRQKDILMVGAEVESQNPEGSKVKVPANRRRATEEEDEELEEDSEVDKKQLRGQNEHKKPGRKNTVRLSTRLCTMCFDGTLLGDRREIRRNLHLGDGFDELLCECLKKGFDPERTGDDGLPLPFQSFATTSMCETTCEPTKEELAAREADEKAQVEEEAQSTRQADIEADFYMHQSMELEEFTAGQKAKEDAFQRELQKEKEDFLKAQKEARDRFHADLQEGVI